MSNIDLIKSFKYISKENEFFIQGNKCFLISYNTYSNNTKFKEYFGLFRGYSIVPYFGHNNQEPYLCEDFCDFDEFHIYDNFGNEISELSINEYKCLLRKEKLKKIYD